MKTIDLTALVTPEMPVFPGDPEYRHEWHTYFESYPVCCSLLTFGPHTGTHVDAPLHFIMNGQSIDQLPIDRFFGPAICLDCRRDPMSDICIDDLNKATIEPGGIVLLYSGWQQKSGTKEFFEPGWPGISREAANRLVEIGAKAVGVDMPSVDSMAGLAEGAPAHMALLGAGMPLFESLINLDKIIGHSFTFHALPLNLQGCEASPVRAIAELP